MSLSLGIVLLASSAAVQGPPPSMCLIVNNKPQYITGQATDSSESLAKGYAENQWKMKAAMYGNSYQNWYKAADKSVSCVGSGSPFKRTKTCTYRARPCT